MKNLTKPILTLIAAGFALTALSTQEAQAAKINGRIDFAGSLIFDSSALQDVTQVVGWRDIFGNFGFSNVAAFTGSFVGFVNLGDQATMATPWTFTMNTPGLWSVGGFTFYLTSATVVMQNAEFLSIRGVGTVSGNGFEDTTARWAFTVQNAGGGTGGFFSFSANSARGTATATPDFNGDGHPDYALYNASTQRTQLWYLNNNIRIGGVFGPSLPTGWSLVGVADFNGDGYPDYALYNASTQRTQLWYLNNNIYIGGVSGPRLPTGWDLRGLADFNNDGYPDYALYNASTQRTQLWYLNNNIRIGGVFGPRLPTGWRLVGLADFNGDGYPDYVLYNASTQRTQLWYLNNNIYIGGVFGPRLPTGWSLVGVADFNGDGYPDYALYNASTQRTQLWYLNNNIYIGGLFGPRLPTGWSLVAP